MQSGRCANNAPMCHFVSNLYIPVQRDEGEIRTSCHRVLYGSLDGAYIETCPRDVSMASIHL
jgi:hypothetical protein